jgi:penicillin-binding protein 1C
MKQWQNKYNIKSIALTLLVFGGVWFWFCLPQKLFEEPYSLAVEDRDGELLGAVIASDGQWRFPEIDSIPPIWRQAILCFEDRRFMRHIGVDPLAVGRAIIENIKAGKIISGASTLTMQVVRLSRQGKKRTLGQKLIEAVLALRLELRYSKEEILMLYASHAPFGGNVVGLEAASWRYYHKAPRHLSLAEAAALAILPNAPSIIHPGRNRQAFEKKRNALLHTLLAENQIDTIQYQLALLEKLPGPPMALPQLAPHFLQYINQNNGTHRKFKTSIRGGLQKKLIATTNDHHALNRMSDINNLAVIVVETETGKILGYIGNAHDTQHEGMVDAIHAYRSSGSVLKPFLYGHMLDEGQILPQTLIPDIPTQIHGFKPRNYNRDFAGAVHANQALSQSLNIPFVILLRQYGIDKFLSRLSDHGFKSVNRSADDYGLSLILGGAEISLFDLTKSYAAMGASLIDYYKQQGQYRSLKSYQLTYNNEVPLMQYASSQDQLSPGAIYLTFEALKNLSRPDSEGQWQQFASTRAIAWKTGTSYGHKDAWAIGVTPEYTIGVWVGNADGEGKSGLVGVEKAAPLLFDILNQLPTTSWFHPPLDELYSRPTCGQSGHLAGPYCDVIDTSFVLQNYQGTQQCPYHHLIHLDEFSYLAQSDCTPTYQMHSRNWFTLPPAQAYYYKRAHPEYMELPGPNPACNKHSLDKAYNPLALIYPAEKSKIYLPKDGDGTIQHAVFKAAHDQKNAVIHWHLDNKYLGSTQELHTMKIQALEGNHSVLIVDQYGNEARQTFDILQ